MDVLLPHPIDRVMANFSSQEIWTETTETELKPTGMRGKHANLNTADSDKPTN